MGIHIDINGDISNKYDNQRIDSRGLIMQDFFCEITIKQWDSGYRTSHQTMKGPPENIQTDMGKKHQLNVDHFLRRNNGYLYIYIP